MAREVERRWPGTLSSTLKWKVAYAAFLQSPEWKAKREAVLKRSLYQCEECLTAPAEEVHHTTYVYGTDAPLFALRALCRACHARIHGLDET